MISKLHNKYRYQILLKNPQIENIQKLLKISLPDFKINRKNNLEIDTDPVDLF
jgi:primosomal protein N'